MKKFIAISLFCICLVGCGNQPASDTTANPKNEVVDKQTASPEVKEEQKEEQKNEYPTAVVISTEIGQPVGDRTADNVGQENGDYFAIGSDIVACADYDSIHVTAQLTNTTGELLNTSAIAWSAKMEDGYELGLFQDGVGIGIMNEGTLSKQIQANSTETFEFDIYKKKDVTGSKIILNYRDINYGDKYNEMMKMAFSGSSEEDCKKVCPEFFDDNLVQQFEIALN
ncbi:hypothetical protein QTL86_12680 [Cellulosilyticum sp. ST5]|uniref:hypothetical protein n=1 Tax=Cellulosilyticum sp. ST5 TaxID=3055805 RepID=UPI003977DD7D